MPEQQMPPVFRFAPSPNGHLHLGHAYSALLNEQYARQTGGKLLLRIEDVDLQRSRVEFEASIEDDLAWLGITFDEPLRRQSEHLPLYQEVLDGLVKRGLAYPSAFSRSEIAASALGNPDWPRDPDGALLPPPLCRSAAADAAKPHAIRLNMTAALSQLTTVVEWNEADKTVGFDASTWGDVVLKTRDGSFAYHLAVVVDDAAQNVTDIIRGNDLFAATAIHRVLQDLLGYKAPNYRHHSLILDNKGEKLAKSRNSPTIKALRSEAITPDQLRKQLGF